MPNKIKAISLTPDEQEALWLLYGSEPYDLSPESINTAIKQLRSTDKGFARFIERRLDPLLTRLITKKRGIYYEKARLVRARLALLGQNPHFQADVELVRKILMIPSGQIKITPDDPIYVELSTIVKEGSEKKVAEANIVNKWLYIHRNAALSIPIEGEDEELLARNLFESAIASANIDLRGKDIPEWLKIPENYKNKIIPIDWAAKQLKKRYSLPLHIEDAITRYVLTRDRSYIENLSPLNISTIHDQNSQDPDAFKICVTGMDENTTKSEWTDVWTNYVRRQQKFIWMRKGRIPKGRKTLDIERLKNAMPAYCKMVKDDLSIKETYSLENLDVDDVQIELQSFVVLIHDLEKILRPDRSK